MILLVLIALHLICPGLPASSFTRILRASPLAYDADLIFTYDSITHHADCAKHCEIDCLSFNYNFDTEECRTFSKRFCWNNTADIVPTDMHFVKGQMEPMPGNLADCSELDPELFCSGVYRITPTPGHSFNVYCDMDTTDGPWTVIQNRQNGDEEFYRPWDDYKHGFGNLLGNFWAGNEVIHYLTRVDSILRIELVSWLGDARYAQYSTFEVASEADKYRLNIDGFSGDVSVDHMRYHNGMQFSTYDNDNDVIGYMNCAALHQSGWWHKGCLEVNLNGRVYVNGSGNEKSVIWSDFYQNIHRTHMMNTKMLVKPQV